MSLQQQMSLLKKCQSGKLIRSISVLILDDIFFYNRHIFFMLYNCLNSSLNIKGKFHLQFLSSSTPSGKCKDTSFAWFYRSFFTPGFPYWWCVQAAPARCFKIYLLFHFPLLKTTVVTIITIWIKWKKIYVLPSQKHKV